MSSREQLPLFVDELSSLRFKLPHELKKGMFLIYWIFSLNFIRPNLKSLNLMTTKAILFSLSSFFSIASFAQPSFEIGQSVTWYIENVFLGDGVLISDVTINGMSGDSICNQVGNFTNDGSYLPLASGLVLSTGDVLGTNFSGDTVFAGASTTIGLSGLSASNDPDLMSIADENINDQVIIEFDFVPELPFLLYNYAFGSEEYPEYVNSFNDAFGFFISGPNINGPYSSPMGFPNGSENVAMVPGTDMSVSINNVNNGQGDCFFGGPTGPCTNCAYYIDNCPIEVGAFDGMTSTFSILLPVTPDSTYHIKMALGDALDGSFDSAVFLDAFSFKTVAQPPLGLSSYQMESVMIAQNPVQDELILSDIPSEISEFQLLDIQGRVVFKMSHLRSETHREDVRFLEAGIYLLMMSDGNGKFWSQKLIKE